MTIGGVISMFDAMKIINKCQKFLKKYNIPMDNELHIFKKNGLIHCQIEDWRGPVELDHFPVLTVQSAVDLLVESHVVGYYYEDEAKKREELMADFPAAYGEYDCRKYAFESALLALKDYDIKIYKKYITVYTRYLNHNKIIKRWHYNENNNHFEK